jgi:hypothetical protein
MRLISHRGNLDGPEPDKENRPEFIQAAIDKGYDVEVDVRLIDGKLFLGHDKPDHAICIEWLLERKDRLWVHAKNFQAMDLLIEHGFQIFCHQADRHAVIGNTRYLWSCDLSEANERSVIPLISSDEVDGNKGLDMRFHGVCSDYIRRFGS